MKTASSTLVTKNPIIDCLQMIQYSGLHLVFLKAKFLSMAKQLQLTIYSKECLNYVLL